MPLRFGSAHRNILVCPWNTQLHITMARLEVNTNLATYTQHEGPSRDESVRSKNVVVGVCHDGTGDKRDATTVANVGPKGFQCWVVTSRATQLG